jgi:hypothetical protein
MARYLILATDAFYGNTTVYYSQHGWTPTRKHATPLPRKRADALVAEFTTSPDIARRFKEAVVVVR